MAHEYEGNMVNEFDAEVEVTTQTRSPTQWEMYHDPVFFGMWAVRPVGDRSFISPRLFHFQYKADAEAFLDLLGKSFHAGKQI